MLADVHFDPFREPAKVAQLRAAPVEAWAGILAGDQAATGGGGRDKEGDLAAVQKQCGIRAFDTDWSLFQKALGAAQAAEARPAFVLLAGDLLTHDFPCRFRTTVPAAGDADMSAFAAKTVQFVIGELQRTFPGIPVYTALGNNDSGCADYHLAPGDAFLQRAMAAALTAAHVASGTATPTGDYNAPLPASMGKTRLLVLNDVVASRLFRSCGGGASSTLAKAELQWLREQLAGARTRGEAVWVMGHIPPGIDLYTSYRNYVFRPGSMCEAKPQWFLEDWSLAELLLDYRDVVRLLVLGHTHMDEFRVLEAEPDGGAIPAKIIPSISPILGNHPAFLVGKVDRRTAVLTDWRTIVSPGAQGSTPPWTEAYSFQQAYKMPDFGAASADRLGRELSADRQGSSAASSTFRKHLYPGDIGLFALGVGQIWPAYGCAVQEQGEAAFQQCLCPAKTK